MSKHTPGPWIAGDDESSDFFLVGPHDGDGIVYQPVVKLHNESNARLIAAAPELLEALKACLPYLEGMSDKLKIATASPEVAVLNVRIVKARAAIAKAEEA